MNNNVLGKLKYLVLSAVFIAALVAVGIVNINRTASVEAQKSSYTRTDFDYFISSPNAEQAASIENDDSVDALFTAYALNNAFSGSEEKRAIFLLLSDDLADYEISLFNEKTLIKGSFDKSGVMLDQLAAKILGVKVGDTLSFSILGNRFTRKVSAVYMTSTFGTLASGIALVDYSEDIKNVFTRSAYSFAFLKSSDKQATEELLKNYVGEGNVSMTYEEYVAVRCGEKPPYKTQEEFDAECEEKYATYREDVLATALRAGAQVASKSEAFVMIKDKVATTEQSITTLNVSVSIASFVLFIILNAIFVFANRSDDEIMIRKGEGSSKTFLRLFIAAALSALVIIVFTFSILYIVAASGIYLSDCIGTILLLVLSVLVAVPVIAVSEFFYVKNLYANSSAKHRTYRGDRW